MIFLNTPDDYSFVNNPIGFKINSESANKVDALVRIFSSRATNSIMTGTDLKTVGATWTINKTGITPSLYFDASDNFVFSIFDENPFIDAYTGSSTPQLEAHESLIVESVVAGQYVLRSRDIAFPTVTTKGYSIIGNTLTILETGTITIKGKIEITTSDSLGAGTASPSSIAFGSHQCPAENEAGEENIDQTFPVDLSFTVTKGDVLNISAHVGFGFDRGVTDPVLVYIKSINDAGEESPLSIELTPTSFESINYKVKVLDSTSNILYTKKIAATEKSTNNIYKFVTDFASVFSIPSQFLTIQILEVADDIGTETLIASTRLYYFKDFLFLDTSYRKFDGLPFYNSAISPYWGQFSLSSYPIYNSYLCYFEIADIIKSYFLTIQSASDLILSYEVIFNNSISTLYYRGIAVYGGISNLFRKWLIDKFTNAFDFRFLNPLANFLLTTRTASQTMSLYRDELYSLFFLSPSDAEISIMTASGETYTVGTYVKATPVMINLPVILNSFSGTQTSVYVCVGGQKIITINIKDIESEEKYIIRFRNSLGVFEKLLVTGKGTSKPTFSEEDSYNEYSSVYNTFSKNRLRVSVTDKAEISSGYKSSLNLEFIKDLLSSDECYFYDGEFERKCMVTSSDFSKSFLQTKPESVTFTIEYSEIENNYSPVNQITMTNILVSTEALEWILTEDQFLIKTE